MSNPTVKPSKKKRKSPVFLKSAGGGAVFKLFGIPPVLEPLTKPIKRVFHLTLLGSILGPLYMAHRTSYTSLLASLRGFSYLSLPQFLSVLFSRDAAQTPDISDAPVPRFFSFSGGVGRILIRVI